MFVFLNGRLIPAADAVVSVFDRGFLYGDGLFETLRVMKGVPLDWDGHWRRLAHGAETLKVKLPFTSEVLRAQARELSRHNQLPEAILRLTLSRGVGSRGYSPRGADTPTFIMSLHPAPVLGPRAPQWKLHTASLRLPTGDALSGCKSASKLLYVLARAAAEAAGANDALLLNVRGELAESASGNLFWLEQETVHTPPLESGALPGTTRELVLGWCAEHRLVFCETVAKRARLLRASGCFLTLSSLGVVEVTALDGKTIPTASLTRRIRKGVLSSWRRMAKRVE
ncbi:MAG: hypothetical protein FJ406_04235 [Verrucomicrobia bacterium]|nr:hypothetical protein [Verrucomicrobiota bacterium]